MSKQRADGHTIVAGFGGPSDKAQGEQPVNARIIGTLTELSESLGLSKSEIDRHIDDYMNGVRKFEALDSMILTHGLKDKAVLEIGSGLGGSILHLCHRGIDVTGIEPGENWCDIARQRLTEAGFEAERVVQGVGEALPFPEGSFDFVFSQQVLEHVKDPERVVSEIRRVLRPGGEVRISAPNYMSFMEKHYFVAWFPGLPAPLGSLYLRLRGRDPKFYREHVNNLTYLQVVRAANKAGLENLLLTTRLREWSEASNQNDSSPKRIFLSIASLFGTTAMKAIYHLRLVFKNEITYVFRKSNK